MITKERLEELIKQEATIYTYCNICIKLSREYDWKVDWLYDKEDEVKLCGCNWDISYPLDELYETKEEAEFARENYDTRIEKFEPPFWNDFVRCPHFKFSFWVYDDFENKLETTEIEENSGNIYIGEKDFGEFNKTNYQKAVDYAHKLFKGEE